MFNGIRICIEADYKTMSRKAAEFFTAALAKKPDGVYGFATGSTPEGMYGELVNMHHEKEADLSRLTAFNLDEYHPIRQNDPQSYFTFMRRQIFDAVGIDPSRTNIPSGEAADPVAECEAYERRIAEAGGIDLQILGIGTNGHIGFNEPAESFSAKTSHVPLSEITIQANARFFENADDVPRYALTMGIRSIMMARRIMLLASGESKAAILRDSLKGPITPLVPASVLQLHPDVTVFADEAAAVFL
jgi:glucosamine-6-phosphate deaminase